MKLLYTESLITVCHADSLRLDGHGNSFGSIGSFIGFSESMWMSSLYVFSGLEVAILPTAKQLKLAHRCEP